MKKIPGKLAALLLILFSGGGCGENSAPPPIRKIGDGVFGEKYSVETGRLSQTRYMMLFGFNLEQQLVTTPISGKLWQSSFFIAEMPGRGDPVSIARKWFAEIFNFPHDKVPGFAVEIAPAYSRSPRGVRITLTHLATAGINRTESSLPEGRKIIEQEKLYQRLLTISSALEEHLLDTGKYPEFLLELQISAGDPKWRGPYLQEIPTDLQGRDFIYRRQEDPQQKYLLYSTGVDGKKIISLPQ